MVSNDNKQEFNPLIVIPSPRDIDIVEKKVSEILYSKYDVLWVKYYPALKAYNIGVNHFKDNTNYTHLCILPDDLLLNKESFDMLVSNCINGNYDAISGICNMSLLNQKEANQANVTFDKEPDPSVYKTREIMDMFATFEEVGNSLIPQKVLFAGLPVTFISRSVLEKMNYTFTQNERYKCCLDLMFCKFLKANKIDHYFISAARFLHLKQDRTNRQTTTLYVGKKQPYTKLISF